MKFIRLYTGSDQKSYFEEIDSGPGTQKELGSYSQNYPASAMQFRDSQPGKSFTWHNAPQPQFIVYLEGEVSVEASGGETMIFKAGDILFATDLTGQGHISKCLTKGRAIVIKT